MYINRHDDHRHYKHLFAPVTQVAVNAMGTCHDNNAKILTL